MFGQGFNSPQLHQRFEPRLKACHKTAGLGTSSLPPYLRHALCLALRFVPLMGTEIVTRLCLDISISRHSLSAIAIPSRTLSAPYDSPQLHHATEVGSSAGFRSFLRGDAVGSAPLLLAFVKQTGCTLARHDTPVSWRPPTWALAVRQLPSAPPALRADARAARYESISPGTMTDTQLQWSARMPYCPDLIGTTSDEHLPSKKGLFIVKTCRSNGFTALGQVVDLAVDDRT